MGFVNLCLISNGFVLFSIYIVCLTRILEWEVLSVRKNRAKKMRYSVEFLQQLLCLVFQLVGKGVTRGIISENEAR